MSLSVVIPTRNTFDLVAACVASVVREAAATSPATSIQIVVVDDGGEDDAATQLARRWPVVEPIRLSPGVGFAAAVNRGLEKTDRELLLLLNSDTELRPGSLAALLGAFADPRVGIVGGALSYPDGTPQWSGGSEPSLAWLFALTSGLGRLRKRRPYSAAGSFEERGWVTGAALAARKRVFDECGLLSTAFHFYAQDLDFCLRASDRNWVVGVAPGFKVLHHHGATIGDSAGAADGGPGQQRLRFLWPDLLRAYHRRHGAAAGRLARGAMCAGGLLAWLAAALSGGAIRRRAIEEGLRALWGERLDESSAPAARLGEP